MRILYSHSLPPEDHPAARMVLTIATELQALGHHVRVHRTRPGDPPPAGGGAKRSGQQVVRRRLWFARELSRNAGGYQRDAEAVALFRPDVVLNRQDAYGFSMARAAGKARVPLVTYADAPVAYESRHVNPGGRWHPPGLCEAVEKWGLRRSRAVVTVSSPAAAILSRYGLDVPIHVVPNGVDGTLFRPLADADRAAVRAALGVTTRHVAGFVGTFQPFHGLDLLRELIARTADRADLTWMLVGDGGGRAALEAGLAGRPRVVFAGRQPQPEVAQMLGAMDVLVVPQQRTVPEFYFCPLKVLEGMASGAVCLAGEQGDVPALLDGGRAGSLVAGDDPEAWAARLRGLLDYPLLRANLSAAARRRAEALSWRTTATRVAAVLDGVVSARVSVRDAGRDSSFVIPGVR